MALLIDLSKKVLRRLIDAAHKKEKKLGSWDAPNDPNFDVSATVEKITSSKVVDELDVEERERLFEESLSEPQEALRAKAKEMKAAPEFYSEEEIQEACDEFHKSLSPQQIKELNAIHKLKLKNIGANLLSVIQDATLDADPEFFEASLSSIMNRKVAIPPEEDEKQHRFAISYIFRELDRKLDIQYDERGAPVHIGWNDGKEQWHMTPKPITDSKADFSAMEQLLATDIAEALADPEVWKRIPTRQGKAFMVGRTYGVTDNLTFNVMNMIEHQEELKGQTKHVFKIGDTAVSESEYDNEAARRNEQKEEGKSADYTGLREEIIVTGEKAQNRMRDWLGIDTNKIKDVQKRGV